MRRVFGFLVKLGVGFVALSLVLVVLFRFVPVPVTVSWQPPAAQVFVEIVPPWLICSSAVKIGWMHFWK